MGRPESAVDWVNSFPHTRSAYVRYEVGVTKPIFLECGLPQRSSLSLILFLIYMAEAVAGNQRRFSYADDIALLEIG